MWWDVPLIGVQIWFLDQVLLFQYGQSTHERTCSNLFNKLSVRTVSRIRNISGGLLCTKHGLRSLSAPFLKFSLMPDRYSIVEVRKTRHLCMTWLTLAVARWVSCHLNGALRRRMNDNDPRSLWSEPAGCTYLAWLAAAKEWEHTLTAARPCWVKRV